MLILGRGRRVREASLRKKEGGAPHSGGAHSEKGGMGKGDKKQFLKKDRPFLLGEFFK